MVSRTAFRIPKCPKWVFDNGAFTDWRDGRPFDEDKFFRCVERMMDLPDDKKPGWCVCPDLVAHPNSLEHSMRWRDRMTNQLKWFLAIQDGMKPEDVELALRYAEFNGLFVGGSTEWKNAMACEWVRFGHSKGLPVHVGRVNGWKRLQWCVDIDADSVDGSGWTRDPRWIEYLEQMPAKSAMLFGPT